MSDRTSRRLYCIQRPDQTLIQKSVSDDPKLCWELALATDKRCAKYGRTWSGARMASPSRSFVSSAAATGVGRPKSCS